MAAPAAVLLAGIAGRAEARRRNDPLGTQPQVFADTIGVGTVAATGPLVSRIERRRFLDDLSPRAQLSSPRPQSPNRATLQELGLTEADLQGVDNNNDGVISGRAELSVLYDRLVAMDTQRPLPAGQLDRTERMFAHLGRAATQDSVPGVPETEAAPVRLAAGRRRIDGTERDVFVSLTPQVAAEAAARRARSPIEAGQRARRGQEPVEAYVAAMEAREAGEPRPAGVPGYLWNITAALEKRGVGSADIQHYLATGRLADWTDADGTILRSGQQRLQDLENSAQRRGSWTAVNTMTFLVNLRRAELHGEVGRLTTQRDALPEGDPQRTALNTRIGQMQTSNTELRRFLGTIYSNATNARERSATASLVRGERYAQQATAARAANDPTQAAQLDARAETYRNRGARMAHSEATYRSQFAHTQLDAARAFDLAAQAQIGRGASQIEVQTATNTLSATPPAALGNDDGTNTGNGVPGAQRLLTDSRAHAPDGGNNHRTLGLEGARQASLSRFHAAHLDQADYFQRVGSASSVPARTPAVQEHAQAYVDARVEQGQAASQRLQLYGPPESLSGAEALNAAQVAGEHRQIVDELSSSLASSITSRRRWAQSSEQTQTLRRADTNSGEAVRQAQGQEDDADAGVGRAADAADSWAGDVFKTSGEARRDRQSVRDARTIEAETNDQLRAAQRRQRETQAALRQSEGSTARASTQSQRDTQYGDVTKLGLQRLGVDAIGDSNTYMGARGMADASARLQQGHLDRAATDVPPREGAARQRALQVAGGRLELSAYWARSARTEFSVRRDASRPEAPARLDRGARLLSQVDATRTSLAADDTAHPALTVGLLHQRAAQAEAEAPYRPTEARAQLRQAEGLLTTDLASAPDAVQRAAHGRIGQAAIGSLFTQEAEFDAIYQSGRHQEGVADELYAMSGRHLAEDVSDDLPQTEAARRQLGMLDASLARIPEVFRVSASQMREGARYASAQVGSMGHSERGANSAKMSVVGTGAIWVSTLGFVDIREDMMELTDDVVAGRQRAISGQAREASAGAVQLESGWQSAASQGRRFDFLHGLRVMAHNRDYDVPDERYRASVGTVKSFLPEASRDDHGWLAFMVAGAINPESSPVPLAASLAGPAYGFDQAMQTFGHGDEAAVTDHMQSFVRHSADSLRESSENVGWYVAINTGLEVALGLVLTGGIGSAASLAEAGNALNAGRAGVQALNAARTATMLTRAGTALRGLRAAHPVLSAMGTTAVVGGGMMGASHLARRAFGANTSAARAFDAATNFIPFGAGQRMGGLPGRLEGAWGRVAQAGLGAGQATLTMAATPEIAQALGVRSEAGQAAIGLALNAVLMGGMAYRGARASSGHRQTADRAATHLLSGGDAASSRLRSRQLRSDVETFLRRTDGRVPSNVEMTRLKTGLYRRMGIPEGRTGDAARGRVDATVNALRIDRAVTLGLRPAQAETRTRSAGEARTPAQVDAALQRSADALFQARGGEAGGTTRVRAFQDAAQAMSTRLAADGSPEAARVLVDRTDAVVMTTMMASGRRPMIRAHQRPRAEGIVAQEMPNLGSGRSLEARLVQEAGLTPEAARLLGQSARLRAAERQAVVTVAEAQASRSTPMTDAEVAQSVRQTTERFGLDPEVARDLQGAAQSEGFRDWVRHQLSPRHWTPDQMQAGLLQRYPGHGSELGTLSTAEFTQAFGSGPYARELVVLGNQPGFGAFAKAHPTEARQLYRAALELGDARATQLIQASANPAHANAFLNAAAQLHAQMPTYSPTPHNYQAVVARPSGRTTDTPGLHLRPDVSHDHNGAFHHPGQVARRGTQRLSGVPTEQSSPTTIHAGQLNRSNGQPFVDLSQVLMFSGHGSPSGISGMGPAQLAPYLADQIAAYNAGRPAGQRLEYVCLNSCSQGTSRHMGLGSTNAQVLQRALDAEMGQRNLPRVEVLAAREAGPTYGGRWHRSAVKHRTAPGTPGQPSGPREYQFREAEYVPVGQQNGGLSTHDYKSMAQTAGAGVLFVGLSGAGGLLIAHALRQQREERRREAVPETPRPQSPRPARQQP